MAMTSPKQYDHNGSVCCIVYLPKNSSKVDADAVVFA